MRLILSIIANDVDCPDSTHQSRLHYRAHGQLCSFVLMKASINLNNCTVI